MNKRLISLIGALLLGFVGQVFPELAQCPFVTVKNSAECDVSEMSPAELKETTVNYFNKLFTTVEYSTKMKLGKDSYAIAAKVRFAELFGDDKQVKPTVFVCHDGDTKKYFVLSSSMINAIVKGIQQQAFVFNKFKKLESIDIKKFIPVELQEKRMSTDFTEVSSVSSCASQDIVAESAGSSELRDEEKAIKIQSLFRGFRARKAFTAMQQEAQDGVAHQIATDSIMNAITSVSQPVVAQRTFLQQATEFMQEHPRVVGVAGVVVGGIVTVIAGCHAVRRATR